MPSSELTLIMPADSRFISTARVAAASLAAELDFSIDEIEELQMGTNELIAILTELAADNDVPTVELRYLVLDQTIEVHGLINAAGIDVELDILATQILDSVVDNYGFTGPTAHIVKHRAVG